MVDDDHGIVIPDPDSLSQNSFTKKKNVYVLGCLLILTDGYESNPHFIDEETDSELSNSLQVHNSEET